MQTRQRCMRGLFVSTTALFCLSFSAPSRSEPSPRQADPSQAEVSSPTERPAEAAESPASEPPPPEATEKTDSPEETQDGSDSAHATSSDDPAHSDGNELPAESESAQNRSHSGGSRPPADSESAQAPADPPHSGQDDAKKAPLPPPESETTMDDLMEELLVDDSEDDDLGWLYSDEIYESSNLAGRPIAPTLPGRGAGSPRSWKSHWKEFSTANYIIAGAGIGLGVTGALFQPRANAWTSRIAVDERVHDNLGIHDFNGGVWARDTSDLLLSASVAFPLLVDSLIVVHWYRNSGEVAKQMALISAETLGVMAGIQAMTAGLASRERPYVRHCGDELPADLSECHGKNPYRSFFSGHTSLSFAGAGLTCSHHIHHDVFGTGLSDGLACGGAMLVAGTVGLMRIVGDQHYLTDVLVGAGMGTMIGLGLPWLLHYRPSGRSRSDPDKLTWQLMPVPHGLGVGGKF